MDLPDGGPDTGRILGLDYGKKRIGVAVSDPFGHFAIGLETIVLNPKTDVIETIRRHCSAYHVRQVVLGLPRHMDGREGPEAEAVRAFGDRLAEALGIAVCYLDERLTSVIAQQTLREQGIQGSRNRGLIDQAAACKILQDYLDRLQSGRAGN